MDAQWTDPVPFDGLRPPPRPGLMKVSLRPGSRLLGREGQRVGLADCLYVGSTINLKYRIARQHFRTGATGRSVLRGSLGALLKAFLNLCAVPRHSDKDCTHYEFTGHGEDALTSWMKAHLLVCVCEAPRECLKALKDKVKAQLRPVLDAQDPSNPHRDFIRRLRKQCADEARKCG